MISIERLRYLKKFLVIQKTLVKFEHCNIVFVKNESNITRNI